MGVRVHSTQQPSRVQQTQALLCTPLPLAVACHGLASFVCAVWRVWWCAAEPDFLFRARQLSDLEDGLSPSTRALLTAALPALPVLLLGLVSLEAKDLVGRGIDVGGG